MTAPAAPFVSKAEFYFSETLDATELCRTARLACIQDLYRPLARRIRTLLRDKEQHISHLAEEGEGQFLVNDLCHACQALRKLTSKPSLQATAFQCIDRSSPPVGVQEYLTVHFERLFLLEPPTALTWVMWS